MSLDSKLLVKGSTEGTFDTDSCDEISVKSVGERFLRNRLDCEEKRSLTLRENTRVLQDIVEIITCKVFRNITRQMFKQRDFLHSRKSHPRHQSDIKHKSHKSNH